ncbi:MAG: prephenate dehydrogenase/arogenate dehydrogenase family protein, partial [Parachlamydiaceae bacterium]|nr:prephenate dehydrogenase/arogenate dehydrogenase family protein [Parachlamydiaceae bacterium]
HNSSKTIENVKEFIQFLGSESICLEANVHDKQAALVSHIPSILSKSYLDFVEAVDPESMKISGPGFQTFTRLAHDNPQMRNEITDCNQRIIEKYLTEWLEFLKQRHT